ncbi:MAG: ribonuclease H-like domain-containing protein [Candidatus Acidiferrales bacterium]
MSATTQDRFARLKALRRPAAAGASSGESLRQEARTYETLGATLPGSSPDVPEGAERLARILGAGVKRNRFGEHLGLRRWFADTIDCAPPESHLGATALRLLAPGAVDDVSDPSQWLFLDTETTGLCGGTGTYPFLIGIAWWDAGGLEVEQFFMREHSEEHSVLVALAERMAERPVLVTFNGKSFDWPLLETRYRMTRKIRAPELRAHLDFLHPARNLWRLRLGSVRLAELERHVLGWNRGTDVMSELIPSLYFDFLRGGPSEPLVPIFYHNQMDLRGLAGLSTRVLSLLAAAETESKDAFELFGVSRICERRGEAARARILFQQSIDGELPVETERAARRSLALMAKRDGDFTRALGLWESMLGNSREGLEAYEQMAIYYERHAREPHTAAALTKKALGELRRASHSRTVAPSLHRRTRVRFEHRLARLERTLEKRREKNARRALLDTMESESRTKAGESN